jgi:cobalt-zinc-cadmium efflux system membrane fusion protein
MHEIRICRTACLFGTILLVMTGCSNDQPESDHGHEHGGIAVTVWTDQTEIFFEYPPMVAGVAGGAWAIHVTRLSDFKPVTEGILRLNLESATGEVYSFAEEAPARDGIFLPEPLVGESGVFTVSMDVESPQLTDHIFAGEITVYPSEELLPTDEVEATGLEIGFLKEQQWPIEFGVAKAEPRPIRQTVAVNGAIHPAAGRMASVTANVGGLLLVDSNLGAPAVGDTVRRGQRLAVIAPIGGDNSYAELKARVERLRRESERLKRLFEAEAIPEHRLIEVQHDLEVAEAAFKSMGGASEGGYNYTVRAPLTGVVYEREMVPGSRVMAGDPLFSIVNPTVVWLRVDLPPGDAMHADGLREVVFAVEGNSRRYRADQIVSVGSVLNRDTRTLPVTLSVDNRDRSLKIGMFAEGLALVNERVDGIAIPAKAIQREDGQPVVYVQTGGESFERREPELGATDGEYSIVESGVSSGEHVVTKGAYQVYLASLAGSEIGDHGHAH